MSMNSQAAMSCTCELCTVRKRRSLEHLRESRRTLVKQQTLPSQTMQRLVKDASALPAWTRELKKARSYSQDCKYDSDEEDTSEEIHQLVEAEKPMDIFRRSRSRTRKRMVKRNSFDSLINGDSEINPATISASFGDVRIIHSSPTPPQSPSSGSPEISRNTSVGNISVHSAPTPPYSIITSATTTPSSSAECSPEIRRKQWRYKILHLKDDIDKVCSKVKKLNLRDSVEAFKAKKGHHQHQHQQEDEEEGDEEGRKVKVKFVDKLSHRRHKSHKLCLEEDTYDVPDHTISPSLVLTSLQNCMFTAHASMYKLPPGDMTLHVSGYKVSIIIERKKNKTLDDNHRITKPLKYGEIDLPIYVNPISIKFHYDSKCQVLRLTGMTKGHDMKGISASNEDLRMIDKPRSKQKLKLRELKLNKDSKMSTPDLKTSPVKSNKHLLVPKETDSSDESFRIRAYTK